MQAQIWNDLRIFLAAARSIALMAAGRVKQLNEYGQSV